MSCPHQTSALTERLPPDGWRATRRIIREWGTGQAIITFNDRLAFGAYRALHEAGLSVPADTSVVSFDDSPLAKWLRPGLTTFAIPHHDLGRQAVELLIESMSPMIASRPSPSLPCTGSTCRYASAGPSWHLRTSPRLAGDSSSGPFSRR